MICIDLRKNETDLFKIGQFPDGEPTFEFKKELDRKECYLVIISINNPTKLYILGLVCDILNRHGVTFEVHITYLMSARMDRVMDFKRPYSLKVICSILEAFNNDTLFVLEPHSSKLTEINRNIIDEHICSEIIFNLFNKVNTVFINPDEGAFHRNSFNMPKYITFDKVRDLSTGNIIGHDINPKLSNITSIPKEDALVVVDDLCDGGRTFVSIANKLKEIAPDNKRYIYVTHMVNPLGIKNLSENYDIVYFTDSYKDWNAETLPENVTCIPVEV